MALFKEIQRDDDALVEFISSTCDEQRVEGTAVYLSKRVDTVPLAMLHNVKHYHVLHERNIILVVDTETSPYLLDDQRAVVTPLGHAFYHVVLHFGFFEKQDVPAELSNCRFDGEQIAMAKTSFFMSRALIVAAERGKRRTNPLFRRIFIWMHRNESDASEFFDLPRNRVVELGTRVMI